MNRKTSWTICCVVALVVVALTYSPLVMAPGKYEPSWGPIPYSLVWGFVIAAIMIGLTVIGHFVHPVNDEEEEL
jgi:hypothetical protein